MINLNNDDQCFIVFELLFCAVEVKIEKHDISVIASIFSSSRQYCLPFPKGVLKRANIGHLEHQQRYVGLISDPNAVFLILGEKSRVFPIYSGKGSLFERVGEGEDPCLLAILNNCVDNPCPVGSLGTP